MPRERFLSAFFLVAICAVFSFGIARLSSLDKSQVKYPDHQTNRTEQKRRTPITNIAPPRYVAVSAETPADKKEETAIDEAESRRKEYEYRAIKDTARYTGELVVATWVGAALLGFQAIFLVWNLIYARRTLVGTQRPKIEIRHLYIAPTQEQNREGPQSLHIHIVNSGITGCAIRHGIARWLFVTEGREVQELPMPPMYDPGWIIGNDARLNAGAWIEFSIDLPVDMGTLRRHRTMLQRLYVVGRFIYVDDISVRRSMGFCRRYNWNTRRFEPGNDPDYEYED